MRTLVTGGTGYIGVGALVRAVESPPPPGTRRIVEVPEIRRARLD